MLDSGAGDAPCESDGQPRRVPCEARRAAMKYKRAKVAKRILEFYSVHFGVRPPYKVGAGRAAAPRGRG